MSDSKKWWVRPVSLGVGVLYPVVVAGICYGKEPDELDAAPTGAAIVTGAAGAASSLSSTATTVAEFPNMSGDEAIKVVVVKPGGSLLWKRQGRSSS